MLKMCALEAGAGELHCLAGEVQSAPIAAPLYTASTQISLAPAISDSSVPMHTLGLVGGTASV